MELIAFFLLSAPRTKFHAFSPFHTISAVYLVWEELFYLHFKLARRLFLSSALFKGKFIMNIQFLNGKKLSPTNERGEKGC